jgi:hypothetical protein
LATPDGREDGSNPLPRELDAWEILEDFEDGAARPSGVIKELVAQRRVGEVE